MFPNGAIGKSFSHIDICFYNFPLHIVFMSIFGTPIFLNARNITFGRHSEESTFQIVVQNFITVSIFGNLYKLHL